MKLKFETKSILSFFVNNGEKVFFAFVVIGFLMFVWKSIGREKYDKEPDALVQLARRAEETIQNGPTEIEGKVEDVKKKIEEISSPLNVEPYEYLTLFHRPVHNPLSKRGEPVLYSVEKLIGTPGRGLFESSGGGRTVAAGRGAVGRGGAAREGKRWVVLTGLVNYEKFNKSFSECYREAAKRFPTDYPQFLYYQVQRAEVIEEGQDPSTLRWEKPYGTLVKQLKKYGFGASASRDVIDSVHYDKTLTFPLPSRSDREWGDEVVHLPEIPRLALDASGRAVSRDGRTPDRSGGTGGTFDFLEGNGANDRSRTAAREASAKEKKVLPYFLFRFFDFNAEPGKRYRYRVQLWLRNPNWQVPGQFVNQEIRKRMQDEKNWKQYIKSGWSEPSEVVRMTLDDRLLAREVNPSRRADADPTADLLAIHWDVNTGREIYEEFSVQRGMMVNLFDKKIPADQQGRLSLAPPKPKEPEAGRSRGRSDRGRARGGGGGQTVNYQTEMLVLDMRGGETLPGKNRDLTRPGEILLLDPSGSIVVRNDQKDLKARQQVKRPPRRSRGMEGPQGPGRPPRRHPSDQVGLP